MDDVLGFLGSLILFVVILAICAWITQSVWNSDMPMWLKWFILK
jgi:hypothetical protein